MFLTPSSHSLLVIIQWIISWERKSACAISAHACRWRFFLVAVDHEPKEVDHNSSSCVEDIFLKIEFPFASTVSLGHQLRGLSPLPIPRPSLKLQA
jgi:hypothetical protein